LLDVAAFSQHIPVDTPDRWEGATSFDEPLELPLACRAFTAEETVAVERYRHGDQVLGHGVDDGGLE
jgi:hypothetical protein